MNSAPQLIVALDLPTASQAIRIVEELNGFPVIYKVGYQLYLSAGSAFVRELVEMKNRVFLDLKLHDIPNTVGSAVAQLCNLRVDLFTVHLSGGRKMIEAARRELQNHSQHSQGGKVPQMIGVTVLTSFDDSEWAEVTQTLTGYAVDVEDSVEGLSAKATDWGLDGLVCSAHELKAMRSKGVDLFTVVPGIRPVGADSGDQARVMTPLEAKEAGASSIVVGRPITQSNDPRGVVKSILQDLEA